MLLQINLFAQTITVKDGSTTDQGLPIEPFYGYSYSEQIFLQSEIISAGGLAGDITEIYFEYNGNSGWTDNIVIFMGHTSKSTYSGTSDWITSASMTEVYNGTFTATLTTGWYLITLDNPFTYNGTDNLVIAVDENTSGYHNSADDFYCAAATDRALVYRNDATNPDPASPPTASYLRSYVPSLKLSLITGPTINVSENSISDLEYCVGNGPSASQSFSVEGTNLTDDIIVSAPTNFEISTDGTNFFNSRTLTQSGGNVNTTTIYVRLKSGLSQNSYSGNITVSSTDATDETISLSGMVGTDTYYVETSGNDVTGNGSSGNPFATLQKAINMVTCSPTTIYVGAGTFNEKNILMPDGMSGLTIIGEGIDVTIFDGDADAGADASWMRIGLGVSAMIDISISNMTIQDYTSSNFGGGGIKLLGDDDGDATSSTTSYFGSDDNTEGITNFVIEDIKFQNCHTEDANPSTGDNRGGAVEMLGATSETYSVSINRCYFINNWCYDEGSALRFDLGANSSITVENCLFYDNDHYTTTKDGVVISGSSSNVDYNNCTFTENGETGSIIYGISGVVNVNNCIIYNNACVYSVESVGSTVTMNYCLYSDPINITATSNNRIGDATTDPLFTNASSDDFSLQITSPAIDVASATYAPADDILKATRPSGSADDLGCYEYIQSTTIITINDASGTAGSSVVVPVTAYDLSGLVGFQWTIEYDDSKLSYINCSDWHTDVTGSIMINSSTSGKLMFVYNDYPNEIDIADDLFFNINFDIASDASGEACLTWSDDPTPRELSDMTPDEIFATWETGCVLITPIPPTITINDTVGVAGKNVVVDVTAENINKLVGFQWTIDYDDTKLTYLNCSNWHSDVSGSVMINSSTSGKLMFVYNDYPNEIDIADNLFFKINFAIDGGATGTACLSWSDDPTPRELSDAVPQEITATWVNGCITIVPEGYWTGEVSTEWDNIMNWTDRIVPTISTNAVIPDVSAESNRFPYIVVAAECDNLNIDAGANVQIAPDYSLTVASILVNNAGTSGLIVKSDATGTGSLIHYSTNVDATVERFLSAPSEPQWHYISPSIIDINRSLFNSTNFYFYNETTDDYWWGVDYQGEMGWTNPSGLLQTLRGYIYYYYETTILYEGKLHYNPAGYTINATYTEHAGIDPVFSNPYTNYDGWNLLGNPYPCAIDWNQVSLTDVQNTVYFYDDNSDNYKYYNNGGTTYDNGISVNGGSRYIPVGQGFFVKTDDPVDGGSLTIPISARVHNTQDFWKNSETETSNYLRISTQNGDFSDELIIRVLPDATYNFDSNYDAYKRFSWNDKVPQIYTMNTEKNTEFAINTLPKFDETIKIPLGYSINSSGNFYFELSELNMENVDVYIEDKQNETFNRINEQEKYFFNFESGNNRDRFVLHLVKENQTNFAEENMEINVFPNPTSDKLTLKVSNFSYGCRYFISDATGKIILNEEITSSMTEIDMSIFSSGIYVIGIEVDNQIFKKAIIKY